MTELCPSLDATEVFIRRAFGEMRDKSGVPLADHCVRVMRLLPPNASHEEKTVALLHDVLEDTEYTAADLLNLGYPLVVVTAVELLTRDKGVYPDYHDYVRAIRYSGNTMALRVKIADNADNSDEARMTTLSPEDQARFRDRYRIARSILTQVMTPELYRAVVIATGLRLYARTGMRPNRAWTPTAMMRVAREITGRTFPARAYMEAADALSAWAEEHK